MSETITPLAPPYPQRSNAAKRDAVLRLLHDPTWRQRSDRAIAREAGVHHQLVGRLRKVDDSSSISRPTRAPARHLAQPQHMALEITETLVSLGLTPVVAQRRHDRPQPLAPRERRAAERVLRKLLLW
jgi:hypothetical protein